MKQIEAVDYVETTVEWEQWIVSDSDSESDLIWLLSVTRCRATYMLRQADATGSVDIIYRFWCISPFWRSGIVIEVRK